MTETILEEVAAFVELAEDDGNMSGRLQPSPPDRSGELKELKREI